MSVFVYGGKVVAGLCLLREGLDQIAGGVYILTDASSLVRSSCDLDKTIASCETRLMALASIETCR